MTTSPSPHGTPRAPKTAAGHRRAWWATVVLAVALAAIWLAMPAPHVAADTERLPVVGQGRAVLINHDVGDPSILTVPAGTDGYRKTTFVLTWTTDGRRNVPMATSTDLVHWRQRRDALPRLPVWAAPLRGTTWGPTEVQVGRSYVLYYSTVDARSNDECIGRGVAPDPTGPFVDTSKHPLVCQRYRGGDIDPNVVIVNGRAVNLIWKNDGNHDGKPVAIWTAALTPDGLALAARPHRLLRADQRWEHGIIEGPAMQQDSQGGWWLFFSGGFWQSSSYDTGVAWCATPTGPCRNAADGPILRTGPGAVSPGGFSTFTGPGGEKWASWSVFFSRPANPLAALSSDRVLEVAPMLSY